MDSSSRLAVLLAALLAVALGCTGTIGGPGAGDDPERPGGPGDPGDPDDPGWEAPELRPLDPLARRLTREELAHTLADLTGVAPGAALEEVPVDRPLEGFVNIGSGQTVLPDHVRGYHAVAREVTADPAFAGFLEVAGCAEPSEACARDTVREVGRRLFRRPLDAREQAAFEALFAAVAAEEVGWEGAARAVAEAMLQSPGFLYLLQDELAGRGDGDGDANVRTLGGYEMASRLSYALWASAPDEALLDAAEAGELDEPAGIAAQVERMLEDEAKVARVTERFVVDWARLASLPDEDGRKGELMASAVAFYDDHARRGAPLYGLFDAERAFLTPALAEAWGLEPAGEGVRAYDLSGLDGRGGLLGQPGVIAGMTNADGGAIVARGLFLQHQVFCGSPPDPPASLQDEIDAFAAALPETASDREVFERRLMRTECAACHAQIDPLALAFERYDYRGAFREADEHGNALDDRGWLPASLNVDGVEVAYAGLGEYLGLVAAHPRARRCLVQRHAEQALGATLESGQIGAVVELVEAVGEEGSRADLLRALTTHDLFRTQRVPE